MYCGEEITTDRVNALTSEYAYENNAIRFTADFSTFSLTVLAVKCIRRYVGNGNQ